MVAVEKGLDRAANALKQIAYSPMAIEIRRPQA
jgi:hypothetical protein